MRTRRIIRQNRKEADSFINRTVSIIKVIRIELLIAITALMISLGQYFQHSINARINITQTWRNGYTSDTRNRVTKFIYLYKKEKKYCEDSNDKKDECLSRLKTSLSILIETEKLYGKQEKLYGKGNVITDDFIKRLVADDVEKIRNEKIKNYLSTKSESQPKTEKVSKEVTNDEYIVLVLNYKNAIIECLNTLEAVKAVIESKPLPFRITIFYKDTLEGRYKDIIEELRDGLVDFIDAYREDHSDRETEAWYVLTSDESYLNDVVNVSLYFLIFFVSLILVYLIKSRMQTLGYLQEK